MKQILKGRPAARNTDYTKWNEYQLCQKWSCTPSQLRNELAEDVELHLTFMQEEAEAEKAKQKR